MTRTRLMLVALSGAMLASLALTPAALAKHNNGAPKIKGKLVEINLVDGVIQMPAQIKHGWTTFHITNSGAYPHGLSARGSKKVFTLATTLPPGSAVMVPIKLKKGTYTVWDPTGDAAAQGMQVTVVVY